MAPTYAVPTLMSVPCCGSDLLEVSLLFLLCAGGDDMLTAPTSRVALSLKDVAQLGQQAVEEIEHWPRRSIPPSKLELLLLLLWYGVVVVSNWI